MKVAFLICNEVLVEVLSYFDRRQLAKLERACRRFHRIVVRYFNDAPFLFFEMECYVREESRRFNKILSSTDTEEEDCLPSVVFICVWNLISKCMSKNTFETAKNYRERWKGHYGPSPNGVPASGVSREDSRLGCWKKLNFKNWEKFKIPKPSGYFGSFIANFCKPSRSYF